MAINPFQSGQQFELQQATREQTLLERLRRERGINALAGMFGEGALAPTAFAAVTGSERAERIFQANQAQRVLTNLRDVRLDTANAAQRKTLNERAERIFASDEKQRGIVADLNERKFGTKKDHFAILQNLNERKFLSEENFDKINQDLKERQFLSGESQVAVENALKARTFEEGIRRFGVKEERAGRTFEEDVRQFGVKEERAGRTFEEGVRQFGVTGERAERILQTKEEQQDLENQRQAVLDQRAQQEADLKRLTGAALNVVGLFQNGLDNNVPFELLATSARKTLLALGQDPKETEAIIQAISEDPTNVLPQIKAALMAARKKGTRGQPGRIIAGSVGGKDVFFRGVEEGVEILKGVTPTAPEFRRRGFELRAEGLGIRVSEGDRKTLNDIRAERKTIEEGRTFAEATVAAAKTVTRDISDLIELLPLGNLTEAELRNERGKDNIAFATSRTAQSLILGTDEFNQKKLIDSVKSNIAIDSLLRIKKSGAGLGQVPQSQLILLQSLLGNLDISRDPPLLLQNIRDVQDRYTEVIQLMGTRDTTLEKREQALTRRRDNIEDKLFGGKETTTQRFIFNPETGQVEPK